MKARLGLGYLLLVLASYGLRAANHAGPEPAPGQKLAGVRGRPLAYREWDSGAGSEGVIVLLHGSPGSSADFRTLGPALGGRFRVLAPDLPGFGRSMRAVPDYSIAAHADWVLAWLDTLGVARFHALGFSMGGGVALELARQAPARVQSIALVASIGVQERELLGDYRLNHTLHELQYGVLWLLRYATPHFGWLDDAFLSVEYARNFLDTDQRSLRRVLEQWKGPLWILHGRRDPLVPVQAAYEHAALAPQARLEILDDSHFFVFRNGAAVARRWFGFHDGASAPVVPPPPPQGPHIGAAAQALLTAGAVFLRGFETPLRAGGLAAQRRLSLPAVMAGSFLGGLMAALAAFGTGRLLWRRPGMAEWRVLVLLAVCRPLPFAWLPACFAAGVAAPRAWRFLLAASGLSALWAVAAPLAGAFAGVAA